MAHSLLFVWLAYALLSPTLAYSFALEDAVGDVASTQWPLPLQQLEEGELDLQHVMVSTEETGAVLFDLQFAGNLSNLHQAPLGFSVPLVQIYLHPAPPGSWRIYVPPGASREPLSNPNIQLSDQYYWEHMVRSPPRSVEGPRAHECPTLRRWRSRAMAAASLLLMLSPKTSP